MLPKLNRSCVDRKWNNPRGSPIFFRKAFLTFGTISLKLLDGILCNFVQGWITGLGRCVRNLGRIQVSPENWQWFYWISVIFPSIFIFTLPISPWVLNGFLWNFIRMWIVMYSKDYEILGRIHVVAFVWDTFSFFCLH